MEFSAPPLDVMHGDEPPIEEWPLPASVEHVDVKHVVRVGNTVYDIRVEERLGNNWVNASIQAVTDHDHAPHLEITRDGVDPDYKSLLVDRLEIARGDGQQPRFMKRVDICTQVQGDADVWLNRCLYNMLFIDRSEVEDWYVDTRAGKVASWQASNANGVAVSVLNSHNDTMTFQETDATYTNAEYAMDIFESNAPSDVITRETLQDATVPTWCFVSRSKSRLFWTSNSAPPASLNPRSVTQAASTPPFVQPATQTEWTVRRPSANSYLLANPNPSASSSASTGSISPSSSAGALDAMSSLLSAMTAKT